MLAIFAVICSANKGHEDDDHGAEPGVQDESWQECISAIQEIAYNNSTHQLQKFSSHDFHHAKEACEQCEHFYCILFADSSFILIVVLFCIVVVSALADWGLEWMEEAIHHSRHIHGYLFEKIKSELLILGLISFCLL
jgi:hypothetical protein